MPFTICNMFDHYSYLPSMQVTECGMSDAVGPVFIDSKLSGDFQKSIDAEVLHHTMLIVLVVC